jgi:hypothetical protein
VIVIYCKQKFKKYLETIPGQHSTDSLHVTRDIIIIIKVKQSLYTPLRRLGGEEV